MLTVSVGQQKGPNSSPWQGPTAHHTTSASKCVRIGLQTFASPPYSSDLSPIDCHFFKHLDNFLQGKCFHNQECFPRVCQIPKQGFLHCRSKQTFLAGKNVLIVMVPIYMNKDVCGPSYNDLKFMVRNHNYFCTNLIFSCVI